MNLVELGCLFFRVRLWHLLINTSFAVGYIVTFAF